jgi:hypothetical protein
LKAVALAEENHKVFVAVALTFDTGETVVQMNHNRDNYNLKGTGKLPVRIGPPPLPAATPFSV